MDTGPTATEVATSIAQLLVEAAATLAAADVGTPRLDAEVLLAAACGMDRTALYGRGHEPVSNRDHATFRTMLARRTAREPLAYIVGRQEFWSLDFQVTADVLIPRPETELLVELALGAVVHNTNPLLCDLGTGSGCIAVALARELPRAEVWAVDNSPAALHIAATNAQRHGVADRIRFLHSDLFASAGGVRFDAIVANPPYVCSADVERLQPEVRWEPRQALDGGSTGRGVIERVLKTAPEHLVDGGWLLMEIGADQDAAVSALVRGAGFSQVSVRTDYAGLPRVVLARR